MRILLLPDGIKRVPDYDAKIIVSALKPRLAELSRRAYFTEGPGQQLLSSRISNRPFASLAMTTKEMTIYPLHAKASLLARESRTFSWSSALDRTSALFTVQNVI